MGPAFLWSDGFRAYDFGPTHPLRPQRVERARTLLRERGLLRPDEEREPAPAEEADLLLVHEPAYVAAVKAGRPSPEHGLGWGDNPVFPGMHEAASLIAGASVAAVRSALEGRAAPVANLAGGLHHALPGRASGFCIYNDAAVAIAWARKRYGVRVAYVDIDAHHGDGVQAAFYEEPDVLTVSLHESGRYLFPGTGFPDEIGRGPGRGYALNIPLLPGTGDDSFLECLERALDVVDRFRPDLLVTQCGVDGHRSDPLAHLAYTTAAYRRAAALFRSAADAWCDGRWVILGGGGYSWDDAAPRCWALLWAEATGRAGTGAAASAGAVDLADLDDPPAPPTPPEIAAENRRVAREATRACLQAMAGGRGA